jgi:CheY-like chemotaxis protein
MKIRAFVFDDDEIVRSFISTVFERRGYEVCEFSEPRACPFLLDRECPCPKDHVCTDIIISDLDMPNMNGLELIENQIKHGCRAPNFALVSGNWSESELKRAQEIGCMTFSKPVRVGELTDWMNQCEKRIDPKRNLWDWSQHYPHDTRGDR